MQTKAVSIKVENRALHIIWQNGQATVTGIPAYVPDEETEKYVNWVLDRAKVLVQLEALVSTEGGIA